MLIEGLQEDVQQQLDEIDGQAARKERNGNA